MRQVLFVCVGNVHRSQIAEAFFNNYTPPGYRALSAGLRPGKAVNPDAVAVMAEVGIDLNGQTPKPLTEELLSRACKVISLCDEAACAPGVDEAWPIPDPLHQPLEMLRAVRDEIKERVMDLIARLEEERKARR